MAASIETLTEAAECAFWRTLADLVPADTGDVAPLIAARFSAAARAAVADWLANNAPDAIPADAEDDTTGGDIWEPIHGEAEEA